MSAVKANSNASFTFSTLHLSWEVSCRYTAKSLPVNRSEITLATSLISRSLHTSSTCSSHSTTHWWGDPSNSGISFRSCDLSTPYPLAMAEIAWVHYRTLGEQ
ncbi:hypothetical protein T11_16034 [Trichinella zimbabwensis]|uniref:Uncharacterized protein n=1 Tax=Trichinella zimbabwensis TaxID=268475 RepID=A0A0V1GSA6_9BILA|nr:hypothetical protein T11_16034 [Trichinella zimbabwensis]